MPRPPRKDLGNQTYHVINRANARSKIFQEASHYELFEAVLFTAVDRFQINLFSYSIMPNHFHLVVFSRRVDELPKFMHWLTLTFTQRWHKRHNTVGNGHLFQGRYKSFPINTDIHLLQVVLYVERNALRAGLVQKAENWKWSSTYKKLTGTREQTSLLSAWPIDVPENYLSLLNTIDADKTLNKIRFSISKSVEIDSGEVKQRGRPKKGT